jgi:hypothetical protein
MGEEKKFGRDKTEKATVQNQTSYEIYQRQDRYPKCKHGKNGDCKFCTKIARKRYSNNSGKGHANGFGGAS